MTNQELIFESASAIDAARRSRAMKRLGAVANALDVPLWVMFVPNLRSEFVSQPQLGRLVAHVENFFATAD